MDMQPESFGALRNLAHLLRTTDQVGDAALLYGQIVALYDACEGHKSHGKASPASKLEKSLPIIAAAETKPEVCAAMETNIETKEGFQAAVREALFYGSEILATKLNKTQAAMHQLQRLVKIDSQNPQALAVLSDLLLNESARIQNMAATLETNATANKSISIQSLKMITLRTGLGKLFGMSKTG